MDRRTEDSVQCSKTNKRRYIQRIRSPTRYMRLNRPRFEGKNFHSRFRFFRMEERVLHRPNFALRYQRHYRGQWSSLQWSRKPRALSPSRQKFSKGQEKSSFITALRQHVQPGTTDIPRTSSADRSSLSLTERDHRGSQKANKRDAAARNRAIQKKQEQIEEKLIQEKRKTVHVSEWSLETPLLQSIVHETPVYRQDCDTFGMVVKMLVAKDPSLEKSIQPSLHENLRDIGTRCIKAMEQFIHEYDSRELDAPASISQTHSIK